MCEKLKAGGYSVSLANSAAPYSLRISIDFKDATVFNERRMPNTASRRHMHSLYRVTNGFCSLCTIGCPLPFRNLDF